jgi:hypothetical protein
MSLTIGTQRIRRKAYSKEQHFLIALSTQTVLQPNCLADCEWRQMHLPINNDRCSQCTCSYWYICFLSVVDQETLFDRCSQCTCSYWYTCFLSVVDQEVLCTRNTEPVPPSILFMSKQTSWPLVRKRTIPTERPSLVGEIRCYLLWIEGCRVVSEADPLRSLISVF